MDIYNLLVRPLVTEKSSGLNTMKKYSVIVRPESNKIQVRQAVEKIYATKVASVRIINVPEKQRLVGRGKVVNKRKNMKKAIITLAKGQKPLELVKVKKAPVAAKTK